MEGAFGWFIDAIGFVAFAGGSFDLGSFDAVARGFLHFLCIEGHSPPQGRWKQRAPLSVDGIIVSDGLVRLPHVFSHEPTWKGPKGKHFFTIWHRNLLVQ